MTRHKVDLIPTATGFAADLSSHIAEANGARLAMTPTTVERVPNQPKTPLHSFRCDDELWEAGKRRAEERGETLADALRKFLRRYTR